MRIIGSESFDPYRVPSSQKMRRRGRKNPANMSQEEIDKRGKKSNPDRKSAEKYIDSFKTKKGGFSKASLSRLGVSWPPKKGWRKELIRQMIQEKNGV